LCYVVILRVRARAWRVARHACDIMHCVISFLLRFYVCVCARGVQVYACMSGRVYLCACVCACACCFAVVWLEFSVPFAFTSRLCAQYNMKSVFAGTCELASPTMALQSGRELRSCAGLRGFTTRESLDFFT